MKHNLGKFPSQVLLSLCGSICLLALIKPTVTQASTYYVSMTGNDTTGDGSQIKPWRNPQKCVDPGSPLVKGDICLVGKGSYTDTDGNGIVIYIRTTAPEGTASAPITLKSEYPLEAVLSVPSTSNSNTGIHVARSHYIIEGFDISGGTGVGEKASNSGITVSNLVSGLTIRGNTIHGQGWGTCHDGAFGNSGIFINASASQITIEHNEIHHIGRLRNGENRCSTTKFHHDHGMYSAGASNLTIRRNVIYETNRGYPLHIYRSGGGTHNNIYVFHNTFSGKSPTGAPPGQIMLCNTLQNVQIKNNIFHDPPQGYAIEYCAVPPSCSDLVLSHNLTDGGRSDFRNPSSRPFSGVTYINNKTNVNPKFVDADSRDYTLTSTSPAVNAGINVGLPYNGIAPDIGAYEFSNGESKGPLHPVDLQLH